MLGVVPGEEVLWPTCQSGFTPSVLVGGLTWHHVTSCCVLELRPLVGNQVLSKKEPERIDRVERYGSTWPIAISMHKKQMVQMSLIASWW